MSVRAFCLQHELIESSFYYWKRELRARDAAAAKIIAAKPPARQRPVAKTLPPVFVPVTVVPMATLSVEVRCPSGHVLLLPSCEVESLASLRSPVAVLIAPP